MEQVIKMTTDFWNWQFFLPVVAILALLFFSRFKLIFLNSGPARFLGIRFFLSAPKTEGKSFTLRKLIAERRIVDFKAEKPVKKLKIYFSLSRCVVKRCKGFDIFVKEMPGGY